MFVRLTGKEVRNVIVGKGGGEEQREGEGRNRVHANLSRDMVQ